MKTLVFILLTYTIIFAQRVTPTTDIGLPSDSTHVKKAEKPQTEDPNLELPDVLITGEDRYHRSILNKKNLTPDSPTLMQPGSPYEPLSTWFKRDEAKPTADDNSTVTDRRSWASLLAGSNITVKADGGHWQRFQDGNFRMQGWLDRTEGQFKNSNTAAGGMAGKVSYELEEHVTGTVDAAYERFGRGLQTTAFQLENTKRKGGTGSFGAELEYDINSLSDAKIGFNIAGVTVESDTAGKKIDHTRDMGYNLFFDYTAQVQTTQITFQGDYQHEKAGTHLDTSDTENSLSSIGVHILQPLGTKFSAVVGANYEFVQLDTLSAKSRISPYARFNIMPNNKFGLTAEATTGYQYKSFLQHWRVNPYLQHKLTMRPDETALKLNLRMDVEVTDKLKIQANISKAWMNSLYYWQADSTTGMFNLNRLKNTELTEIKIGAIYELNDFTRIQAFMIDYSDKLDTDDPNMDTNQIPYKPDFRIPIRVSLQLLQDMNLSLTADIVAQRKTTFDSDKTLAGYGLVDLDLSKEFGKNYSALLSVHNLLDANYTIWQGYKNFGIQIFAGVQAKF